jgi:transposase-like protein
MRAVPLIVVGFGHEQSVSIFQQLAGVISLVVTMYLRYPLSLRNVEIP